MSIPKGLTPRTLYQVSRSLVDTATSASYAATASAAYPSFIIGTNKVLNGLDNTGLLSVGGVNTISAFPTEVERIRIHQSKHTGGGFPWQIFARDPDGDFAHLDIRYGGLTQYSFRHEGQLLVASSLIVGTDPGGPETLRVGGNIRLAGAAPIVVFRETDQTLPAGLWRMPLDANQWFIRRNTAAAGDFSTEETLMIFRAGGQVDVVIGPLIIGTDPGGAQLLRVGGGINANPAGGATSRFYIIEFKRSGGNTSFPDLIGDGTNALVIGGKSDGSGQVNFGATTNVVIGTDPGVPPGGVTALTRGQDRARFGNTLIGTSAAHGGTYASFGNANHNQSVGGNYALLQASGSDNNTYLNALTDQVIDFRINNSSVMRMGSTGLIIGTDPGGTALLRTTNSGLLVNTTGSIANRMFGEIAAAVTMSSADPTGVKPHGTFWIKF